MGLLQASEDPKRKIDVDQKLFERREQRDFSTILECVYSKVEYADFHHVIFQRKKKSDIRTDSDHDLIFQVVVSDSSMYRNIWDISFLIRWW